MIEKSVDDYGAFQEGGQQRRQSGVLRINCIDCLDRTNVVQGWLARKQLDKLLTQLGLLTPGSSIKDTFPEVPCLLLTCTCYVCRAAKPWAGCGDLQKIVSDPHPAT